MASFKSNTQIPLEIDGHQFVIDGISKTVMTAVQMITRQSAELAAQNWIQRITLSCWNRWMIWL